jgi:hypothetical protein
MKSFRVLAIIALIVPSLMSAQIANNYKWMTVGSLHNLESNYGSEIETGRTGKDADQADGLRWPGIYRTQDMQAAKGIWIGATNYTDAKGSYPFKVVHVGPRSTAGSFPGETFPVLFKMTSKYEPPQVFVDGVQTYNILLQNDAVDPTMKWDRLIDNLVQTPLGLTMHRKVIGFSQSFHDNYIIYDYVFTNTGIIDDKGTKRADVTLNNVVIYFINRWGINRDMEPVIGTPVSYGKNLVNDVRGDTVNPGPAKYFPTNTDNNDLRVSFSWHGYAPFFTGGYDNIGGPVFLQATGHLAGDTVGRLGAYQFAGWATLHADKSTHDTTDDKGQPFTTGYESSDGVLMGSGSIDQFNLTAMDGQYKLMTRGHVLPRHADLLTPTNGDPALGTSGGQSATMGYGPYTIAPSESLHLVIAECAAGISRQASYAIGHAFKLSQSAPITYNGVTKSKDDWVFTGKDSLFQTVRRALANYASGWNIPQPPPPPTVVNVNSQANKIHLDWTAPNDPKITGWQVWRALAQYDSTYYKIWEGPANASSYDDTVATFDDAYYYYVVSVGKAADNTGVGLTPSGSLTSSRYYTQTYAPAYRRLGAPLTLDNSRVRIVPNPYNVGAVSRLLWPGQTDKVVFKNIPGICTIRIYTEIGELIKTLNHSDGTGSQDYDLTTSSNQIIVSGIYLAVLDTPQGNRGIYKFVVIR